jgi:hypothetical protein
MDQDFYQEQIRARLPEDVALKFEAALGNMLAAATGPAGSGVPQDEVDKRVAQVKAGHAQELVATQAQAKADLDKVQADFQTQAVKDAEANYKIGHQDGYSMALSELKQLKAQIVALEAQVKQHASQGGASVPQPTQPGDTKAPAVTSVVNQAPPAPASAPVVAPSVAQPESKPTPPAEPAPKPPAHNPLAGLFGRK